MFLPLLFLFHQAMKGVREFHNLSVTLFWNSETIPSLESKFESSGSIPYQSIWFKWGQVNITQKHIWWSEIQQKWQISKELSLLIRYTLTYPTSSLAKVPVKFPLPQEWHNSFRKASRRLDWKLWSGLL